MSVRNRFCLWGTARTNDNPTHSRTNLRAIILVDWHSSELLECKKMDTINILSMYNNFWNSVWTNRFWRIFLHRGTSLGFLILQKIVIHSHVLFFITKQQLFLHLFTHNVFFFCVQIVQNNLTIRVYLSAALVNIVNFIWKMML